MIEAIIFDCFGVLYSDGKSYIRGLCPPEKQLGLDDLYKQVDYGYISNQDFVNNTSQLLGISAGELEDINQQQYIKNQPLASYMKELKKSFRIGLLSNVGEEFFSSLFTKKEQTELFDGVVISSTIGVLKPQREAYERVAKELEIEPSRCVMVDDVQANCDGAEQAGMRAICYTGLNDLKKQLGELIKV